jgi:hypothetical protein
MGGKKSDEGEKKKRRIGKCRKSVINILLRSELEIPSGPKLLAFHFSGGGLSFSFLLIMMLLQRCFTLSKSYRYRAFSSLRSPDVEVDNVVIGGGVVGLALAEMITRERPQESTLLIEKNKRLGEETRYDRFG